LERPHSLEIMSTSSAPILISIEGNIGAGKSTLLGKLKGAHPEWIFVDEPVEQWMAFRNSSEEGGKSLLELFYEDKRRWAYTFQNVAVLTRAEELRKSLDAAAASGLQSPIVVMERCLDTDAEVFAKMLRAEGVLNTVEWDLYQRWRETLVKSFRIPKTSAYIWMDATPDVCAERIRLRGREGEDHIPLSYLEELDAATQQWLTRVQGAHVITQTAWSPLDDVQAVEGFIDRLKSTLAHEGAEPM
jgi:deoxyadenosine/deoxycytidine kinase